MKKNLLLLSAFIAVLAFASCSSSKSTSGTEDAGDLKKRMFNGTWVVDNVEEDPGLKLAPDVNVLGIGDPVCFAGSTWALVSNNNTGNIATSELTPCGASDYNIVWDVNGDSYSFKFVDESEKAKQVKTGYAFQIMTIDETTMSLKTTVRFLNKDCPITFNFIKQ
ncbi:MAG: hypothetical protein ACK5MI_06850 [Mangrovibacterium sp.]